MRFNVHIFYNLDVDVKILIFMGPLIGTVRGVTENPIAHTKFISNNTGAITIVAFDPVCPNPLPNVLEQKALTH